MTELLVATHNPGKVVEINRMLSDLGIRCLTLDDAGITEDIEETGKTFVANAVLKAEGYAGMTGMLTLADDSGLEVDALDGVPGVHTKRYGGLRPPAQYLYLLEQIAGVPDDARGARFRCVMALADPQGLLATAEGVCEGRIAREPAGDGGFGYDPVFLVPRYNRTMAQLPAETKNEISHRGRALAAIAPAVREALVQRR
jgi:XTP/dITP diphosphohydrolase